MDLPPLVEHFCDTPEEIQLVPIRVLETLHQPTGKNSQRFQPFSIDKRWHWQPAIRCDSFPDFDL